MIIHVDQELCSGCGTCIDACSPGAIQLVDQRAVIDDVLCTHCQVCVDACLNEAIMAILIPAQSITMTTLPENDPREVPLQQLETPPLTATPTSRLAPRWHFLDMKLHHALPIYSLPHWNASWRDQQQAPQPRYQNLLRDT